MVPDDLHLVKIIFISKIYYRELIICQAYYIRIFFRSQEYKDKSVPDLM